MDLITSSVPHHLMLLISSFNGDKFRFFSLTNSPTQNRPNSFANQNLQSFPSKYFLYEWFVQMMLRLQLPNSPIGRFLSSQVLNQNIETIDRFWSKLYTLNKNHKPSTKIQQNPFIAFVMLCLQTIQLDSLKNQFIQCKWKTSQSSLINTYIQSISVVKHVQFQLDVSWIIFKQLFVHEKPLLLTYCPIKWPELNLYLQNLIWNYTEFHFPLNSIEFYNQIMGLCIDFIYQYDRHFDWYSFVRFLLDVILGQSDWFKSKCATKVLDCFVMLDCWIYYKWSNNPIGSNKVFGFYWSQNFIIFYNYLIVSV